MQTLLSHTYSIESGIGGAAMELPVSPDKAQWTQIFRMLQQIAALKDDWDGLGATTPAPAVTASAFDFAQMLQNLGWGPPSSVVASPDGTILFNWQNESGYLDADITRVGRVEWMQSVPGQPVRHLATDPFTLIASQATLRQVPVVSYPPIQRWIPDRLLDPSAGAVAAFSPL